MSIIGLGIPLNLPVGLAVDTSGNLYIADSGNNRIVQVAPGGGGSALSITGLSPLSFPTGLALDLAGNLYIADTGNSRAAKVTTGGVGTAVGTSGVALNGPKGVAVGRNGTIYIADTNNNRIVTSDGTNGSLFSTGSVTLSTPQGVAVDALGSVYFASTNNNQVVTAQPQAVGFGSVALGGSAVMLTLPFRVGGGTTLGSVQALTLGAQSLDFTVASGSTCTNGTTGMSCSVNVQFLPVAAGLRRGAIAVLDQSSNVLLTVPIYGVADAPLAALTPGIASALDIGSTTLNLPFQLALDGTGNMYVGNYQGNNVIKIPAGGGTGSVVSTPGVTLGFVTGVALDGAGNLFIGDHVNSRIVKVTSAGAAAVLNISGLSTALNEPTGLAVDGPGNLYISDWQNSRVVRVTPSGAGSVLGLGS